MALAAHSTTVKASGTAVPVLAEATTSLGGGVYQVTSTSRRIWEPSAAITVNDGGSPVGAAFWSFDYLFGKVTFSGYSPGGAVTVDGSYLPVHAVAEVKEFTMSWALELVDKTSFDSGGVRQRHAALRDGSGSVTMYSQTLADIDTVAGGTQSLDSWLTNGTPKLLEVSFGGTYLRAWLLFESQESSAAVEGLAEFMASFTFAAQAAGASAGFGS